MKNKVIISWPLVSQLVLSPGVSFGQAMWLNATAENMPKVFMEYEDGNADGRVTAGEFKGPRQDFLFWDVNGDGVIELSEAPTPDNLPSSLKGGQGPDNRIGDPARLQDESFGQKSVGQVTLNGNTFSLYKKYVFFTWGELPADVNYERMPIQEFTGKDDVNHFYEVVYVASGNLNWFQAASLAEDAGGYLAAINSEDENMFLFALINDEKYFWKFPKYDGNPKRKNHYEITIGPFLGGYQAEGSIEPSGGWKWLSGEAWEYTNWAKNLDDGIIDKDPRDNRQPNDSGNSVQGQRIMGFGEMNTPVPTWGDYMDDVGTYGVKRSPGRSYGFIIEYESDPRSK